MPTKKAVIVSGVRTPFGKFGGMLKEKRAVELGAHALQGALQQAGVGPAEVQEVLMGMVIQAGAGQNPARQAVRLAGLPWEVPSQTINKVCASGFRAVTLAEQIIRAGDAELILAGGMESMSNVPYAWFQARFGQKMGHGEIKDLLLVDGLVCAFETVHMIAHGDEVAKEYGISREAQDAWALRSQERAVQARASGRLTEEILPLTLPVKQATVVSQHDEAIRTTSMEQLNKLSPVLPQGMITPGNAPGVNDGAAALVLMEKQRAERAGKKILAEIIAHTQVGAAAKYITLTPALAIQKLLQQTGYRLEQIDLLEVNEAFAAVALTTGKMLGWAEEKVNVNGGAIAYGHPIGASGARIILTLVHELQRRGGGLGIAAICSGAAQGDAILVKVKD